MDKLDIKELIDAVKLVQQEGGMPDNMFHPDYGWIIKDGEATEAGARWYSDYIEKKPT